MKNSTRFSLGARLTLITLFLFIANSSFSFAQIVANPISFLGNPVDNVSGGTAGDATQNDFLNAVSLNDALITHSIIDNDGLSGLTIDSNGNLEIPPASVPGYYSVTYQICENASPSNSRSLLSSHFLL